ncbi:MAG: hypothetical protein VX867_04820 [Pseudomonadota bacterium]|nr:hypothetical protein [Pseudomonadota bacterium]
MVSESLGFAPGPLGGYCRSDRGATIFLGDSIMQGWDESLAPAFPGPELLIAASVGTLPEGY